MKILVIGGTGLIGRNVCNKLISAGHEVIIGAPSAGVDVITGEGLHDALQGTDIVIDLSNSSSPEEDKALNFFRTAGKNLVAAEKPANIKHHLVLSIVGTDRVQHIGYLRAKKEQEDNIAGSGIPYTIIRSTQFHEHVTTIIAVQGTSDEVHVSTLDYQPIAAEDVATLVTRFALEEPKNVIIEIAGPDKAPMTDFVKSYLDASGDGKRLITNNDDNYMSFVMPRSTLAPQGDFVAGKIRFDDWMKNVLDK